MINPSTLEWILHQATSIQTTAGILFGATLQFFFLERRTARMAILVIVSSFFVALYVVSPVVQLLKIEDPTIKSSFYAFSSLLSLEILAILIHILPKAFRVRVLRFLEVDEDAIEK